MRYITTRAMKGDMLSYMFVVCELSSVKYCNASYAVRVFTKKSCGEILSCVIWLAGGAL